jgi:hypothetical protein
MQACGLVPVPLLLSTRSLANSIQPIHAAPCPCSSLLPQPKNKNKTCAPDNMQDKINNKADTHMQDKIISEYLAILRGSFFKQNSNPLV